MLRFVVSCCLVLSGALAFAQLPSSPQIASLAKAVSANDRAALDAFWSQPSGSFPLVEPHAERPDRRLVTYVFRGRPETKAVILVQQMPTVDNPCYMANIPGTDVWHRTFVVPSAARLTYGFREITDPVPLDPESRMKAFKPPVKDPLNTKSLGNMSLLELPEAPPYKWCEPNPKTPGNDAKETIHSVVLGESREVQVYLPAGYKPGGDYNLLIALDAEAYALPSPVIPLRTILDNLHASGRLAPTVTIMVPYGSQERRMKDYACSEDFAKFLAEELVPFARKRYGAGKSAERTVVAGQSLSGLQAAFTNHKHPRVVGNVLAQGGSFWFTPDFMKGPDIATRFGWFTDQVAAAPSASGNYYLGIDLFEQDQFGHPVMATRALATVLKLKGRQVIEDEYAGGHSYFIWKAAFGDALLSLIGKP